MDGRSITRDAYRYGFQGQEKDDQISGFGSSYDFGERMYNSKLGRFIKVDDLTSSFPYFSPYQYAGNTPIQAIDLDGLEPEFIVDKQGKLTKPMIELFNAAFAYDKAKMQNTTWKKSATSTYNAQTIYHTIWFGAKAEQGDKSFEDWTDYWLNLTVHEHKHRDEYKGIVQWIGWGIRYGIEIALNGFVYSDELNTEQRAYGIEQPMVDLMNFENGLAIKTLESSYDESVKAGVMRYVGTAYNLQKETAELDKSQAALDSFEGNDRQRKRLEKKINKQSKVVEDLNSQINVLKSQYGNQISELNQQEGRKVKLVTTPTVKKKGKKE